ncbi:MAG: hypothetical protein OEL80_07135 [Desulfuromonadales bacterium]|jgi:hypothetical protein|nr:hypothetical protein [Desulfuromonadales bacterium]
MTTIRQELLANGLQIVFTDESNRYFGDYHRVCVVATIVCNLRDLPAATAADEAMCCRAVETFGDQLSVVKRLERMGVPTLEVDQVRTTLIDDFLRHAAAYLSRPEYLRSLVNAELNKRPTHRFYG